MGTIIIVLQGFVCRKAYTYKHCWMEGMGSWALFVSDVFSTTNVLLVTASRGPSSLVKPTKTQIADFDLSVIRAARSASPSL